ncbi:D-inositol-3-phosphate glycosyltransferase [subsurface metagenome]
MNIGFACDWGENRKKTWSGTPYLLYESMKKLDGFNLYDLDINIKGFELFLYKILNLKLYKGKITSKYMFSKLYLNSTKNKLFVNLNKLKNIETLDTILEIGDISIIKNVPFYIYQDLSLDLIIRYLKENSKPISGFELFNLNDLYKRREWQLKVYEKCSGIFTMSKWLAKSLVMDTGLPPKKVHVVHAGVNIMPDKINYHLLGKNKKETIILFIGRDFFRKGGDIVVEAFKILKEKYSSNLKLIIVGPEYWPLNGEIPDGVVLLGDTPGEIIRKFYMTADLLCMPSRFEGFGIAFAEALSFGVPCIGRKLCAMPEIIKPGINGYLIDNENPENLAELMVKVLEDGDMKFKVKKLSNNYRGYYSWNRVASDMVKIMKYDQIKINC